MDLKDVSEWTIYIDDVEGELAMGKHEARGGREIEVVAKEEIMPLFEKALQHLKEALESKERQCRYDHNRNCQEHGVFGLEGDDCPISEAFEFLEKNAITAL